MHKFMLDTNKRVYAANVYPPKINSGRDIGQLCPSEMNTACAVKANATAFGR